MSTIKVSIIKPFKVESIREEVDGTITIFYTCSKSEAMADNSISTTGVSSHTNVPKEDNMDFDMIVFKALEGTGWL